MTANRFSSKPCLQSPVPRCELLVLAMLLALQTSYAQGQTQGQTQSQTKYTPRSISVFDDEVFAKPFADSDLSNALPSEYAIGDPSDADPRAAAFGNWEGGVEEQGQAVYWDDPDLKPFDWVRHFGFRHSSTHGRHVGLGLPLEKTSWKNRPYHVDWFLGPMFGDDLVGNRVAQDNDLFGGIRLGWDFDYFWGLETRFGWSNPNVQFNEPQAVANNGSYFVSDVDLIYYPWGDSKIRPYILLGAGVARIDFVDSSSVNFNTTLFTMPHGGGLQFALRPSMIFRFEVLNNLSFGADGVDTMQNFSFSAGMEYRFGSRSASYWPWQSKRSVW